MLVYWCPTSLRRVLLFFGLVLALTAVAIAHNEEESTRLEIGVQGTTLTLHYLTDFPSMAGFARLKRLDGNGDGQYSEAEKNLFLKARLDDYLSRVSLTVDGKPVTLNATAQEALIAKDVVGLGELSVRYTLMGLLPEPLHEGSRLEFQDPAFGWNSYEIKTSDGMKTSVSELSKGDTMVVTFGAGTAVSGSTGAGQDQDDRLLAMVGSDMTPRVLLWTLALAFGLGALHALTPGHGKTMVAAYLVGSRGTVAQAVLLGLVVTITHTASVFLLGLACMVAFEYVMPEKVIPWLGFVSGLLVTVVGGVLLVGRLSGKEWGHGHSHENGHGHSHGSLLGHSHSAKREDGAHGHSHASDKGHSHARELSLEQGRAGATARPSPLLKVEGLVPRAQVRVPFRSYDHGGAHEPSHSHDHGGAHPHSHDHGGAHEPSHSHDHGGAHAHSHSHDHGGAHEPSHSHDHGDVHAPSHSHDHGDAHAHPHSHDHGGADAPSHSHGHSHEDAHDHSHQHGEPVSRPVTRSVPDAPAEKVSLWALIGLGISGGLVPCPEALVVLLAAISLNKLLLGMLVLVAFSAGLAALLVLIGILVVSATRVSKGLYPSDETIRKVSIVSYIVICCMGLVIATRSLVDGGIISINL